VKEGETNEPEGMSKKSVVLLQENDKNEAKQTMYAIAKGKLYFISFLIYSVRCELCLCIFVSKDESKV